MPWSNNSNINLDLSFAFNQTSNIFHPKILHASFLAFVFFCQQALYCCYSYLPCTNLDTTYSYTNLDTTSYILASALFEKKILYVL